MKKISTIFLCAVIVCNLKAQQTPFLQWQKALGGDSTDEATSIQQTKDGGYIIGGNSTSHNGDVSKNHGHEDYWIIKLDADRNIEWQKSFGGTDVDLLRSIVQTNDSGYIAAGTTRSNDGDVINNHGDYDCWVIKLKPNGNIQWKKTYGGSGYDEANSIQQTVGGGYIIAGSTSSNDGDVTGNHGGFDFWIVKINAAGNIQWQKCFGGTDHEQAESVQQTNGGGYIIAGTAESIDGDVTGHHKLYDRDYWIVKLNSHGVLTWEKSYGGSNLDEATDIKQTNDGGYIVAGNTWSNDGDVTNNHGNPDAWILKLNRTGNLKWQKTWGGSRGDAVTSILQASDGGYIIAGGTEKDFNRGSSDYFVAKLDTTGKQQWQKTLGGSRSETAKSIQQTSDGGYIVAGLSTSVDENVSGRHGDQRLWSADYWIAKLSSDVFNKDVKLSSYHTNECSQHNAVVCNLKDSNTIYTVRLYRFGILYDSALNVSGKIIFHHLLTGSYYVTGISAYNQIHFSKEVDIVPPTDSISAINFNPTVTKIYWKFIDCADQYQMQYHQLGFANWKTIEVPLHDFYYSLQNLLPSTTYVLRMASEKRLNGIKATGKFSDSILFTTASALINTNQSSKIFATTFNSNQLIVSPNPAKSFFVINYKDNTHQKLNATLYNATGKAVWNSGLIKANALDGKKVNVSQFAKGVFYLKLINEQGELIGSTKIVIAQ